MSMYVKYTVRYIDGKECFTLEKRVILSMQGVACHSECSIFLLLSETAN